MNNPTLAEIIAERKLSRREFLGLGMALSALGLTASLLPGRAVARGLPASEMPLGFTEIEKRLDTVPHLAPGYRMQPVIRWGDGLTDTGDFLPRELSAESQARRFGYNNDYIAYMPFPHGSEGSDHGLLCVNHEYTNLRLMFPGLNIDNEVYKATEAMGRVEQEAQGVSIVEVKREGDLWRVLTQGARNRRLTATTPIDITGPAAGSLHLQTFADPEGIRAVGTMANCAGGVTPWGTVLTCEENFDLYFANMPEDHPNFAMWRRYGIGNKLQYNWYRFDKRFDLAEEPNEPNRFGWVVEYDPYDPEWMPKKRTALGRFKHECASTTIAPDGRLVIYSGDDQVFEYVYRFITSKPWNPDDREANRDLLDEGTLSVARFDANGMVEWLDLVHGNGPLTEKSGFGNQAEVVIFARRAADLLGATPMDRPEDVEVNPVTKQLFISLTKNFDRDEERLHPANRRAPNPYGHMLELIPPVTDGKPDHTARRFGWNIFLEGGDPSKPSDHAFYQNPVSENGWLANPDNIAFDPSGRIWIATDGQEETIESNESLYAAQTVGPNKGATKLFLTAPIGAEITGPCFTPDGKTLFVSIQHPGELPDGSTYDHPSTRWPDMRDDLPPRPTVLAVTKSDGGVIGS